MRSTVRAIKVSLSWTKSVILRLSWSSVIKDSATFLRWPAKSSALSATDVASERMVLSRWASIVTKLVSVVDDCREVVVGVADGRECAARRVEEAGEGLALAFELFGSDREEVADVLAVLRGVGQCDEKVVDSGKDVVDVGGRLGALERTTAPSAILARPSRQV